MGMCVRAHTYVQTNMGFSKIMGLTYIYIYPQIVGPLLKGPHKVPPVHGNSHRYMNVYVCVQNSDAKLAAAAAGPARAKAHGRLGPPARPSEPLRDVPRL